jgi:hypothetical protein
MYGTVFIIFGIMVIIAIFLLNGKGAFLVAGYNTMSKDKKAKYDEKALCRFVGWLLIAISFSMLLFPAGIYFKITWLTYFGIAVILLGTIGAVIYANTGNRFQKNANSEVSSKNINNTSKLKSAKSTIIAVSVISVTVFIAVGVLLYQGGKDPVFNIFDDKIQIKALYGLSIDFSDITEITLIEKSMSDIGIGQRINGYGGIGEALKGHFKSNGLGETLLFVQSKSSPTIRIERRDKKDIYISLRNGDNTEQLYHELIATVK